MELKSLYNLNDFLNHFPTRDAFTDQELKKELNEKISRKEPIEFLPNVPNEGSYPSLYNKKQWEYGIAMVGIFPDGRRSIVLIDGIHPYILIEKPKCITGTYPGEIPLGASPEQIHYINEISKQNFLTNVTSKIPASDKPMGYSWENAKPFVGWQLEQSDYLRLTFSKQSSRKKVLSVLKQAGFVTAHDDYSDYYRVVARDYGISLCNWSVISNYSIDSLDNFKQPVFRVNIKDFTKYQGEILKNPALARDKSMIMAWDIECATQSGNLPTPENKDDRLFMICASLHWWYNKKALVKICFVDYPCDPHPDYVTVVCGDERSIIYAFAYLFDKMKPDFCTGFNSSNFDYPWLVQRAYQHGILETICDIMNEIKPFNGFDKGGVRLGHKLSPTTFDAWSRYEARKKFPKITLNNYLANICPIYCYEKVKIDAETFAEGTQMQFGGCISFDLMTIFRQLYPNSEKNSLDYFLSINKLSGKKDMPVVELFRIYWEMTDAVKRAGAELSGDQEKKDAFMVSFNKIRKELKEVAEYCVIDSYRCQELSLMRNVIPDRREVSSLSNTALSDSFFLANGMKVRQMVMERCNTRNLTCTTVCKTIHGSDKYPGAFVKPPEKGLITPKLSIQERMEKHAEYVKNFGLAPVNDGSYRNIPYPEISNIGIDDIYNVIDDQSTKVAEIDVQNYTELINNSMTTSRIIDLPVISNKINQKPNESANPEQKLTDIAFEKISAFQNAIKFIASTDEKLCITNCSDQHINQIIMKTIDLLKPIHLSHNDMKIFGEFLKESTGRPITGLDFSSLYPSLIMTYNLSPEYTIALETCNKSIITVKNKVAQAQTAGHNIKRIKFEYGEQKTDVFGFFIQHENQFPTTDDGKPNPNCKFGVYPTILKELFDQRSVMKVPKEYYEILNEHLDKLNDNNNKYNKIIRLCSYAYPEAINLDEYKDFFTLLEDYEDLQEMKNIPEFAKFLKSAEENDEKKIENYQYSDFVGLFKAKPVERSKTTILSLADAINVIRNKIDYDHAYKPPRPLKHTSDEKIKKILCAFESEESINIKGGISWEDIEFYFNYFDSKQKALKVFMNTFYGESGNKLSSMFVLAMAGAITTKGQENLKRVITFVEGQPSFDEEGSTLQPNTIGQFKVVYGDTDSAYIAAPEHVFRELDILYYSGQINKEEYCSRMVELSFVYVDKIKDEVNTMLKKTSRSIFLKMAYEEVLFPVAFLAKKKYYGIPHISVPNFSPKKLFVRGLETKKRGVSGVLKDLCENLMWKSMRLSNIKELLELSYDAIDEFYKKTWSVDQFSKTSQYKPKSDEDIAEGKGNKSVLRFVERMKARGIEIKPHERFRYVIVRKYPYEYDYRGCKVPLKIGDFMELVDVAKSEHMDINIDYYMENGIVGQLARLVIYRDEFFIESIDDTDEEIKKADDASFKKARGHLDQYASKYYKNYQDKGDAYKYTFHAIDKRMKESYKSMGIEKEQTDIICKDWNYECPKTFFAQLCKHAEEKAIKHAKDYGKLTIPGMLKPSKAQLEMGIKPVELTSLQRMYCGSNASYMKQIITDYRNNLNLTERDFSSMFGEFYKLLNEQRRAINVMSVFVNNIVGIDGMFNNPIEGVKKKKMTDDEIKEYEIVFPDEVENEPENPSVKNIALEKFPHEQFDELFNETEEQIRSNFNIDEISRRLLGISQTLYKTYLVYNQALSIQTYLETQLDKKYRIGITPITKMETKNMINDAIEEGLRSNILDSFDF